MTLWWRFLIFCVLVTITLFVVVGCIRGRPVVHVFFNRCCEDSIENDPKLFENFRNNFLMERLVSFEAIDGRSNNTVVSYEKGDVVKLMDELRTKFNVHDPFQRKTYFDEEFSNSELFDDSVSSEEDTNSYVVTVRTTESDKIT
ncbi:hypothetical protein EVAR_95858_1 [Eumeta japonica]|uniref:Uncharacterized protein n=1 Tax=Eumeta variegata TaxID=151549 RepID=A0A4C1VK96_EUMVA|nr:hypothetical protein EVAR_95858_1 [Eumeta japonica]